MTKHDASPIIKGIARVTPAHARMTRQCGEPSSFVMCNEFGAPMRDPDAYQPPRRRPVVWRFPHGYNPNLMGEVCDRCQRSDRWQGRPIPRQNFTAWTCTCSQTSYPEIPLD